MGTLIDGEGVTRVEGIGFGACDFRGEGVDVLDGA